MTNPAINLAAAIVSGRLFSATIGRIDATPDAWDIAVRHAAYHARHDGQLTPANRMLAALRSAGMLGGMLGRSVVAMLTDALRPVASHDAATGWTIKQAQRAAYLTEALAVTEAAALRGLPDRLATLQTEAAEASALRTAKAAATRAAKAAATPAPVDPSSPLPALLAKLAEAAQAEAAKLTEARKAGPVDLRSAAPVAGLLAGQPGALSALAGLLADAFQCAADDATGALAACRESYSVATVRALAEAEAARTAHATVRVTCEAAQAEAATISAEAAALAEAAAAARRDAMLLRAEAAQALADAEALRAEALASLTQAAAAAQAAMAQAAAAQQVKPQRATRKPQAAPVV